MVAGFGFATAGAAGFFAGAVTADRGVSTFGSAPVVERLVFWPAGLAVRGRTVVEEFEFCADEIVGRAKTKRAVTKNIFLNKAGTPLALIGVCS